ncbi:pyridoxal-phosphate dependent enzyme, partial [Sutterella wadsworthensis]
YGATQSNHVMETATAARRCGMRPVVYLGAIVEPQPNDVRANLLLDTILGAEIHILPSCGRSTKETMEANDHLFQAHIAQLAAQGHKVYNIPIGGSTPIGAAGFAECYIETMEQCESAGLACDYLVTATGSGGTLAGLAAGAAMLHDDSTQLIGIQVGKKDPATYGQKIVELANSVLETAGAQERIDKLPFVIHSEYVGPGYEKPYKEANDDIRYLARTEGIFTDPVYSGKAFHGLMDLIRTGSIPKGSNVVFLHTGGATALFSEPDIIGDLNQIQA